MEGETGGHLAFRCALDPRVAAAVCYFATDIHSHSLGEGKRDNSLDRAGEIRGELLMVRSLSLSFSLSTICFKSKGRGGEGKRFAEALFFLKQTTDPRETGRPRAAGRTGLDTADTA